MSDRLRVRKAAGILILLAGALCCVASAQEKGGENETGPYEVVTGWPQPLGHPGWTWGSQGGVFAESPNRIYILQRGELPIPEKAPAGYTGGFGAFGTPATQGKPRLENCILIVDGDGKLIESWTQWDHLFAGGRGPHHIKISPYDPEKHVWVVDDMVHQVFEFRKGKIVSLHSYYDMLTQLEQLGLAPVTRQATAVSYTHLTLPTICSV